MLIFLIFETIFDRFGRVPGPQKPGVRVQKTYKNLWFFAKIASPGRYGFLTKILEKRFSNPNCTQKYTKMNKKLVCRKRPRGPNSSIFYSQDWPPGAVFGPRPAGPKAPKMYENRSPPILKITDFLENRLAGLFGAS